MAWAIVSGLSLAARPLLGGRRAARSAQTTWFARSLCACPACPPLGVSPALLHAGVLPHCFALTRLACPRASAWALCVRAGGAAPVVGVFACGWLGFVFARGACSLGVFACFGVGALAWGGGTVWSRRPPCPGLLGWCSRSGVGAVGVCAVLRCGSNGNGAGHDCPAPYSVALPPLRGAWKRKRVWVPARSGEHADRGREACGVELACSLAWCVQPTGGVKGEVGIGPCRAGLASVRAIVGLGGDWVARLPSWWWGWVGGNDFPR